MCGSDVLLAADPFVSSFSTLAVFRPEEAPLPAAESPSIVLLEAVVEFETRSPPKPRSMLASIVVSWSPGNVPLLGAAVLGCGKEKPSGSSIAGILSGAEDE